jgi:hypothetical protein
VAGRNQAAKRLGDLEAEKLRHEEKAIAGSVIWRMPVTLLSHFIQLVRLIMRLHYFIFIVVSDGCPLTDFHCRDIGDYDALVICAAG